jgi:predicted RNA-binding Zn ribbon-like protein
MKQPAPGLRRKPAARLTDGGNHALNFINTSKKGSKGNHLQLLTDFASLLNWAEDTGLINWDTWLLLDTEQRNHPHEATLSYCTALSLRECMDELFNDLIMGRQVHPLVLSRFNTHAEAIHAHLRYEHGVTGLRLYWHNIHGDINLPLWLIIAEACQLLNSGASRDIKKCPACGSLFVDTSRRHNRVWCSPKTCGSLKKSQRYYQQQQTA